MNTTVRQPDGLTDDQRNTKIGIANAQEAQRKNQEQQAYDDRVRQEYYYEQGQVAPVSDSGASYDIPVSVSGDEQSRQGWRSRDDLSSLVDLTVAKPTDKAATWSFRTSDKGFKDGFVYIMGVNRYAYGVIDLTDEEYFQTAERLQNIFVAQRNGIEAEEDYGLDSDLEDDDELDASAAPIPSAPPFEAVHGALAPSAPLASTEVRVDPAPVPSAPEPFDPYVHDYVPPAPRQAISLVLQQGMGYSAEEADYIARFVEGQSKRVMARVDSQVENSGDSKLKLMHQTTKADTIYFTYADRLLNCRKVPEFRPSGPRRYMEIGGIESSNKLKERVASGMTVYASSFGVSSERADYMAAFSVGLHTATREANQRHNAALEAERQRQAASRPSPSPYGKVG